MTGVNHETAARTLLSAARLLARKPGEQTRGLWPRASALLARQALETALKTYWSFVAPGAEAVSVTAQLLCLEAYIQATTARQAYQAWSALSMASHHHPYELAPTGDELLRWCDDVEAMIDTTERAWAQ